MPRPPLTVRRSPSGFVVHDPALAAEFGRDALPLPFTPDADPADVLRHLRRANPGRTVCLDGPPAGPPAPYYRSDRITLYHGDCLRVVPALDRSAIGAVVSDPPYGISYKHGGGGSSPRGRTSHRRHSAPVHGDDRPFDPAPWLGFPAVALWGANHFRTRLPDGDGAFHAWDKTRGGHGPDDSFSDVEFLWTSTPGASAILHYLWKGVCQDGEKGERRYHPTQKPIAAQAWAMERAGVPDGALVLDPYAGAGSTGLAALATGRRFVGVEIEERYCEAAARRFERAEPQHTVPFPALP